MSNTTLCYSLKIYSRSTLVATIAMLTIAGLTMRRRPFVATAFSVAQFTTGNASRSPRTTGRSASKCLFAISSSSSTTRMTSFLSPESTCRNPNRSHQSQLLSTLRMSSTIDAPTTTNVDLQKNFDATHPAYDIIEKDIVTEYGAYCTLYRHKKSGAELLSVAVDDDNKVFGITLRTPPDDSTGVPHILEHSVLCGSRKYTTKDPFVHLLKGSLQTFLNAFTYPDRTCYVVASQNEKDFYNLVNVYADAVYHPRAVNDPMVLAQEGWHLEVDEDQNLIYNGVV